MLNIKGFVAVAVLGFFSMTGMASAQSAQQYTADLDAANQAIAANPSDVSAYIKQSNALNNLGRYAEAAASLSKQCTLQPDEDTRTLCLDELSEYKKIHSLP